MTQPNLNSIDEILYGYGEMVYSDAPDYFPSTKDPALFTHAQAKAALQSLIEDRAREARIDELKKAAAHNNSEYTSDYIEDRIAQLSNSKEGK